jgi:hypothetical protein
VNCPSAFLVGALAFSSLNAHAAGEDDAEARGPHEFAQGLELEVPANEPVVELALPAQVYGWVTRSDLGDLRVFNGAGQAVPHGIAALIPNGGERRLERIAAFPIDLPASEDVGGISVTVERTDRGVIKSMTTEGGGVVASRRAYILSAAHLKNRTAPFAWNGSDRERVSFTR